MLELEKADDATRDEDYWTQYYLSGSAPDKPSNFAQYVATHYAENGLKLMELGCGNGRDARFFAGMGLSVLAMDMCAAEIEELNKANDTHQNLEYVAGDFTSLSDAEEPFDLIYSRFTLHSVSAEGQERTLAWCSRNLAKGGKLLVETRGKKNELYGKGEPVEGESDAFVFDEHYRRFVDFGEFKEDIKSAGLDIVEAAEATGFAPFQDTDYFFIRVISKKN
jgi:tellurite methyltransferase